MGEGRTVVAGRTVADARVSAQIVDAALLYRRVEGEWVCGAGTGMGGGYSGVVGRYTAQRKRGETRGDKSVKIGVRTTEDVGRGYG